MATPAKTNSALPSQGGDAGAVSDQSKTGEDCQNQQNSKQANQSTAKGSNDSKNTKKELYYTQTDGVTGQTLTKIQLHLPLSLPATKLPVNLLNTWALAPLP